MAMVDISSVLRIGDVAKESKIKFGLKSRKIKPTTRNRVPSTVSSIPSKYQTFFFETSEKKGFLSQASRFSNLLESDTPGPGSYHPQLENLKTPNASLSTQGIGGLASKTPRFITARTSGPGPDVYDPRVLRNHRDFSRAGVSSNFHPPIAQRTQPSQTSPAPNSYFLVKERNRRHTMDAVFKSMTSRGAMQQGPSLNPAPGYYTINDDRSVSGHESIFKSKTARGFVKHSADMTPGPATYSTSVTESTQRPLLFRPKHHLCFSAPAVPLPPLPPPPGPGHYEIQGSAAPQKKLVSGAVFLSTTSRWAGTASTDLPGPGHYDPKTQGRRSYLCNQEQRWT